MQQVWCTPAERVAFAPVLGQQQHIYMRTCVNTRLCGCPAFVWHAQVGALAVDPAGEAIVTGGGDRLVKLWGYDEGHCYFAGAWLG